MSLDGVSQESEGVAARLAAGLHHRQHHLDETAAVGALGPEGELSPNHGMAQRPLARIVRRLDALPCQAQCVMIV